MELVFRCDTDTIAAIHEFLLPATYIKFNTFRVVDALDTGASFIVEIFNANDEDCTYLLLAFGHTRMYQFAYDRENMTYPVEVSLYGSIFMCNARLKLVLYNG